MLLGHGLLMFLDSSHDLSCKVCPLERGAGTHLSRPGQNPHEEELHNVGVEEEELCALALLCSRVGLHAGLAGSLGKEYVFERSHLWSSLLVMSEANDVQFTYQEQRVGQKCIEKDNPADVAAGASAAVEDLGNRNGGDDANKLVA